MSDHHILIFGQNSMFLHGGYLKLKDPNASSFCVLSQQNTYQASYIVGESVSQRNFLVRDKNEVRHRSKFITPPYPYENSAFENFA